MNVCIRIRIAIYFLVANLSFYGVCKCTCDEDISFFSLFGKTGKRCICHGSLTQILESFSYCPLILTLKNFNTENLNDKHFEYVKGILFDIHISEFNQLKRIEQNTFNQFSELKSLSLSKVQKLTSVSLDIFQNQNQLKYLSITKTGLIHVPVLRLTTQILEYIDFEGNSIQSIKSNNIMVRTTRMNLDYNKISNIEAWAFNNSEISEISLKKNRELKILTEEAFHGLSSLRVLDLSQTSIKNIPSSALKELEVLIVKYTYTLKIIPTIYDFPNLTEAHLTFSFHCCAFQLPARHNPERYALYQIYSERLQHRCGEEKYYNEKIGNVSEISNEDITDKADDEWLDDDVSNVTHHAMNILQHSQTDNAFSVSCNSFRYKRKPVKCEPIPNAFNPCEDIMGYSWLRFSVWFVILIGLLGNACVLIVILSKLSEMAVQNFLISNLAFSDLCMAIFLLLLGIEDSISKGYYFNYAYDWQRGIGCKISGFLTIFSSQLSVFLLCLLTVERWYAIKMALYLNRFTFRRTVLITIIGWLYAIIMATLPLIGISSYTTTSLCLPMDTTTAVNKAYVLLLLFIAAAACAIICFCYFQIYFSLSYETRHKDGEYVLARKMIILVGTNVLCLAPITFFGLTAVLGFPLIDIRRSKILLVFFYPLNACANPFLYAILTKNFKKNFITLLSKCKVCRSVTSNYILIHYRPKHSTKIRMLRPMTSQTVL